MEKPDPKPKIPTYGWFDQIPEAHRDTWLTRNQLAQLGLRPARGAQAVAKVVWRDGKRKAELFDKATAVPKQAPTAAQQAALAKAQQTRRTCPKCGTVHSFVLPSSWRPLRDCGVCNSRWLERVQRAAARAARVWLRSPRTVIIDSETTDLEGYFVQVAVVRACDGEVLFNSLVNPEHEISPGAQMIHGITEEQLAGAPTFTEIAEQLLGLLRGRRVVAYNTAFDHSILYNEISRLATEQAKVDPDELFADDSAAWRFGNETANRLTREMRWRCAMRLYARWWGDYSDYHRDFRWQPLPGADHSALGDCLATRALLQRMAAGLAEDTQRDT